MTIDESVNVFQADEGITGAFSVPVIQKLLAYDKPSALVLYMALLTRATEPTFRAHTGELLGQTGLSRQTFLNARDELADPKGLKLIKVKDVKGSQGIWQYELLTADGHSLATYSATVYADLDADKIRAFYCEVLGQECTELESGHLLFNCPFCHHKKPTLQITIQSGTTLHGRYICVRNNNDCNAHGGFQDLLIEEAARNGKTTTRGAATRRANHLLRTLKPKPAFRPNYQPIIDAQNAVAEEQNWDQVEA